MFWLLTLVLLHLLGLFSAFHAVMTTRTSQGAVAWSISLLTIPYVALPLYWLFGRSKFHGYTQARQKAEKQVSDKLQNIIPQLQKQRVPTNELAILEKTAQRVAKMPWMKANAVELLIDGQETFASMFEGILKAQHYILVEFYIVRDDKLGLEFKNRLIERAKEGLKIYFLYDEIGSYKLSENYLQDMRRAGISVYDFHTQKGAQNHFQINFRNHRKIMIVDGKEAWVGGHNIGDEYVSKNKKFGHWRDTHIKIIGPSVISLQQAFIEDWFWAAEYLIEHLYWQPIAAQTADKKVLIIPSSPADEIETTSLMFLQAINAAKERIWISSPYFVPDSAIIKALQLAGLRGVDVRILIPAKADHLLVYLAAFTYFETAGITGVKFFRYHNGFLHQKVMLIDESHAAVGTANLDNRSFRLNFEITALIADSNFASEIRVMLENDFKDAKRVSVEELQKLPFYFKVATHLARLTSPIL